jgi:hypothetical protein
MGTRVEFHAHQKLNLAVVMTFFPKVQFAAFNTLCIQLKNAQTGTVSNMIEMARSSISELYRLLKFSDDAERLAAINALLQRNTFAVRDSDGGLADGVRGS